MDAILTLNAGSSSLKVALYAGEAADAPLYGGQISGIGTEPVVAVKDASGAGVETPDLPAGRCHDYGGLVGWLLGFIRDRLGLTVAAAGHRVVHGGARFTEPVVVDAAVMAEIERLIPLARSHNPHNLAGIRAVAAAWPELPQVSKQATWGRSGHAAATARMPARLCGL